MKREKPFKSSIFSGAYISTFSPSQKGLLPRIKRDLSTDLDELFFSTL